MNIEKNPSKGGSYGFFFANETFSLAPHQWNFGWYLILRCDQRPGSESSLWMFICIRWNQVKSKKRKYLIKVEDCRELYPTSRSHLVAQTILPWGALCQLPTFGHFSAKLLSIHKHSLMSHVYCSFPYKLLFVSRNLHEMSSVPQNQFVSTRFQRNNHIIDILN